MSQRRHRWRFLRVDRGPRGAVRLWCRCVQCGAVGCGQTWSRRRVPVCDGAPLWNPCADLWVARFRELNRPAPPPDRPLLADIGEWWG